MLRNMPVNFVIHAGFFIDKGIESLKTDLLWSVVGIQRLDLVAQNSVLFSLGCIVSEDVISAVWFWLIKHTAVVAQQIGNWSRRYQCSLKSNSWQTTAKLCTFAQTYTMHLLLRY